MWSSIHNFIKRLQNAEENVRRRWLYVLTGSAIVIVISLWVVYINFTTGEASGVAAAENEKKLENFWALESFAAGTKVIYTQLTAVSSKTFAYIKGTLFQPKLINVQKGAAIFVPTPIETIPKTSLP